MVTTRSGGRAEALTSAAADFRESVSDPLFAAFLVTVLLALIRALNQPHVTFGVSSTSVSLTPADVAFGIVGVWTVARLVHGRGLPRTTWPVLVAAAALAAWIMATSVGNGAGAFVSAGKFVEIGVLALCAVCVIDRRARIWPLVAVLVAMNVAADAWAVEGFIRNLGARQASFLGAHDLAALSTMSLSIWLAHLYADAGSHRRLAHVAGVAGAVGITLGAALASLLGVYLAVAALAATAAYRREFRIQALLVTVLAVGAITGGVLDLRADNLGFLRAWLGIHQKNQPASGEPGAWSQRLIYAYIGGRIFLAHPILGTGWYPDLPPKDYARFLPAAERRFSDQPLRYFPPKHGEFTPQMAYDQVLYELGLVGAVLLALLIAAIARDSARAAHRRAGDDPDAIVAYVAPAWTASLLGVLAGIGFFGGIPVAAVFWLTIGTAAALAAAGPGQAAAASASIASSRA